MDSIEFTAASGETFTKLPGTINGESVVLKDLKDCSVYLLDYSGEVEVTNVQDSQIFIGPVDGPAIFDNVKGCHISVAAQQLQVRGSADSEFAVYSANKPTIEHSTDLRFTCWMGAYPGLTEHFSQANLDPKANQWDKVHDVSAESGEGPNFDLLDAVEYWEVPIEGGPPPDNPVPGANGARYTPPTGAASATPAAADADLFTENGGGNGGGFDGPQENGHVPMGNDNHGREHPKVAAVRAASRERLQKQESEESRSKETLVKDAATYLEKFYQNRNATKGQRSRENRQSADRLATGKGPEGDTEWEKAISLINFGFARPNGSDLSRFKNALFAAKSRNVPITSHIPNTEKA